MSFKKKDLVSVEPNYGKRITKSGNREITGSRLTNKDGEIRVVLNPAGKAAKYAAELKIGVRLTNTGRIKKDKTGKIMVLTERQKAYRVGYLGSRSDNVKAFNAKKGGVK